jgi:hypothetical protein
MRRLAIAALLLVAACGTTRGGAGGAADAPEIPPWQVYVKNPTEIRSGKFTAILPARWESDLTVSGLSDGWKERDGKKSWSGTGDCHLKLFRLDVKCHQLTVTLVPDQPEPEVLLTAEDHVVLAHVSKRIGNLSQDLEFLLIRNDRRMER